MPPIGLFSDLDAVRASSPAVSGLPTRKQLEAWLIEHDKIEKETEIFDSGELKKFKTFTMGQYRSMFLLPFPSLPQRSGVQRSQSGIYPHKIQMS
jgi:hypothetical protein